MTLAGEGSDSSVVVAVVGLATGFLSGFFGIGGGLVMVPGLMIIFGYAIKRAVGISLLTIVGVSIVAVLAEIGVRRTNIHWTMAVVMTAGSLAGSLAAGRLVRRLPDLPMCLLFAGFLLVAAYRMGVGTRASDAGGLVSLAALPLLGYLLALPVGAIAGLTSTLFGLGGGIVTVPGLALLFRDVPFHAARATSLATIVPTAALGAYQHHRMGTTDVATSLKVIPAAVVGAVVGVIGVNLIPSPPCRIAFALFLALTAIRIVTIRRTATNSARAEDRQHVEVRARDGTGCAWS